jgi:hypothetical protein
MGANHWNIGNRIVKSRKYLSGFKLTSSSFKLQVSRFKLLSHKERGWG